MKKMYRKIYLRNNKTGINPKVLDGYKSVWNFTNTIFFYTFVTSYALAIKRYNKCLHRRKSDKAV